METKLTEQQFLKEVENHGMEIIRDDGVYRHIRFMRPDTRCYQFDLITWPGYLCYCGDMGTFVFTRLRDMFEFFRRSNKENLFRIDFRYWAEKCEADDKFGGIKKFSMEKFQNNVNEYVDSRAQSYEPDPDDGDDAKKLYAAAYAELREAVKDEVLGCDDNDVRAYDAANDFYHEGPAWKAFHGEKARFEFVDFWEWDHTEYTHRFVWCCYALVWGIKKYDESKQVAQAA